MGSINKQLSSLLHLYLAYNKHLPGQEGGGGGGPLFSSLKGSTICTGIGNDVYNLYLTGNGGARGGRGEMGRSDRGRDCHLPRYLDFPLVKYA